MNWADRSRPFCTVDAVIFAGPKHIVLIERAKKPLGLALPGGHVEYGESLEDACKREVLEETGLSIFDCEQFYTYSLPDRDPRSHTMSTVFIASCQPWDVPVAGDDAGEAMVVPVEFALEADYAFDHKMIVQDVIFYVNGNPRRTRGA